MLCVKVKHAQALVLAGLCNCADVMGVGGEPGLGVASEVRMVRVFASEVRQVRGGRSGAE